MELRDVIHGTVEVNAAEALIIDSPFFQRLKNIKQLGFGENSFPGATHNRFIHSIGALHLAGVVFEQAFADSDLKKKKNDFERLKQAVKIAALLHDVGHGPLSHTTEFAMPLVERLQLQNIACIPGKPCSFDEPRQANHEDYTSKIILHSSMSEVIAAALAPYGIKPIHVAGIINDSIYCPDDFYEVDGVDYRPILHQMISSEIDVDRMDYLYRDSFYSGVNYGNFDREWLISNITHHIKDGKCYLALNHRALYTFDDFLISRFHMFLMVYFHHKCVIYDELLARYLRSSDCNYEIPSDVEKYIFYDDYHLYTHLGASKNEWAKRVYHKNPYRVLSEFHSNIPMGKAHEDEQKSMIEKIKADLKSKGTDYIIKTTTGELSRYYKNDDSGKEHMPIYVRYDNKFSPVKYYPLEQCTDLFKRYPENRSITRIYVAG